jgi:hypothetical protein
MPKRREKKQEQRYSPLETNEIHPELQAFMEKARRMKRSGLSGKQLYQHEDIQLSKVEAERIEFLRLQRAGLSVVEAEKQAKKNVEQWY